jgi:hypothetical protein
MKSLFRGYFRPSSDEFDHMWREGVFVFDANVLLHIYRYTEQNVSHFFTLLERLKERVWVPHQAALEFLRNRPTVIRDRYRPCTVALDQLDELVEFLRNNFRRGKETLSGMLVESIQHIIYRAKDQIGLCRSKVIDVFHEPDARRDRLATILDGKIGPPYPDEKLKQVYDDIRKRYKDNKPPGYMDARGEKKKPEPDCFGDALLWLQTIDHAKSLKDRRPFIVVTDDTSEDWLLKLEGEKLGPRPELLQEFSDATGCSVYQSGQFMELAIFRFGLVPGLDTKETARAVEEAKQVQKMALGPRALEIYDFICRRIDDRGFPPTIRDIGTAFAIRSPNGVMCHLKALEKKGLIVREGKSARTIRPAKRSDTKDEPKE